MSKAINGKHIPNDKRLYVFEEIDCGQWRDIVINRNIKDIESKQKDRDVQSTMEITKNIIDIMHKVNGPSELQDGKFKIDDDQMNLGEFLELLDGIVEIPGRMMIMTSNHPEILDPALIRPGRIDMMVEFTKMTREDIKNMYKLWFQKDMPYDVEVQVKDYVFSQADIGMLFARQDMCFIHKVLKNGSL